MKHAVDTVVIGGGQAGLAMSYHLQQRAVEHIVLERGRVGERWRSERWDSLMFQFPNWMIRLPGQAYDGPEPDGFTHRDGVVRFIVDYAERIAAPLHCGVTVTRVRRARASDRFIVETDAGEFESRHVVVATGPYQVPAVPRCASALPSSIHQLTANRYSNPGDLPSGGVLVVGSGASGCQIAEDLLRSGRDVWLCTGRHRRVPRRYRGHDFGWWLERIGFLDRTRAELSADFIPPLLTGVDGGRDVDLRRMSRDGVHLTGSLRDVDGNRASFAADLNDHLTRGDEGVREFTAAVDRFVEAHGIEAPREDARAPAGGDIDAIDSIDLSRSGIGSVIWSTGYRNDFGWLDLPVCGARGEVVHERGVSTVPGLYFLGLPRMHKVKSSFMWGVGEDAEHLANHLAGVP